MFYRTVIRPLLFLLPAETAHRAGMAAMRILATLPLGLSLLRALFRRADDALRVRVFGRELRSPIALAAGLDKDAEAFEAFAALGFGAVEVGTITAEAQPGNPRPRLFRLPRDRALVNRMGFNNHGAEAAGRRLAARALRPREYLLGVNIGKTKHVAAEQAVDDYVSSARRLAAYADYLVVNVSSPNTAGLRDLQHVERLRPLLSAVRVALDAAAPQRRVPLLVKIAPDLGDEEIDAVSDLALSLGLDGIVAVNTTSTRPAELHTPATQVARCGEGGLSGPILQARALAVLRRLRARVGTSLVLVSVGGVQSADDVWERLAAGATLVQLYTSLIYEGPGWPSRLHRELVRRMHAAGHRSLAEFAHGSGERAA